jgi:branched-chain amino acid transport system substrate-binding protein
MGAHIEEVNQMGKRIYALAAALVVALAVLVGGSAGAGGTPGVTSSLISIGGTYPLSGPASSYGTIAPAVAAYFSYFNSLRQPQGKRGVFGRQIKFTYLDDGYNPAQTVQLTRQLVEQTKVFAIFNSLGTEPNEAVRAYLNQAKVPQLFVATGASEWGTLAKQYPWTLGYQPTYVSEANAYGQFISKKVPQAKIGVLYQNDSYGKDYIAGLKKGLGAKQSQIVDMEGYEVTAADVGSQIAKLKASGANTLCIFATPKFSIQAFAIAAKLGWNPIVFNNSVSATATLMGIATKSSSAQTTNGTITATYLKDPTDAKWDNDPGMKLYKKIMAAYYPKGNASDQFNVYGMSVAWTMVKALQGAGPNPTRASLMKAARSLNYSDDPFLLPGIKVRTSASNPFPIQQQQLTRWTDGKFVNFGPLIKG